MAKDLRTALEQKLAHPNPATGKVELDVFEALEVLAALEAGVDRKELVALLRFGGECMSDGQTSTPVGSTFFAMASRLEKRGGGKAG